MSDNVIEFKRKIKEAAPVGIKFVMIVVNVDGSDACLEYSDEMNGYEVLGVLEYAKSLKLAETEIA